MGLYGHTAGVYDIAFTPDSHSLLMAVRMGLYGCGMWRGAVCPHLRAMQSRSTTWRGVRMARGSPVQARIRW